MLNIDHIYNVTTFIAGTLLHFPPSWFIDLVPGNGVFSFPYTQGNIGIF